MKILHVNHRDSFHPKSGGLENVVQEISRRWVRDGHRVDILSSGFPGGTRQSTLDGVRIQRIGREEWFNFQAGPWLCRHDWLGADVVIEHLSKVACLLPVFQPRRPLLAHVPHLFGKAIFEEVFYPIGLYVYGMERLIGRIYDQTPFWALSESTADELRTMGLPKNRIRVISGGVDTAFFQGPATPSIYPQVLYVGRLRKYKGLVDPLLPAWAKVRERYPQAKLCILGKGDFESELRRAIAARGWENEVEITGFVSEEEKRERLRSAWLTVYPSVKEGWGLSVIEAGCLGVTTVASCSPGLKEAVRDGETGCLVPHGDAEALAAGLLRLLDDATLRARLGEGARAWAQRFDWEVMSKKVLGYLNEIVNEG